MKDYAIKNKSFIEDEDFRLWILLRQSRDAIRKVRARELSQYGITAGQAATLFVIRAIGEDVTPAEISRWRLQERHSITAILNRMEKDGLIIKTKDLPRKNQVRVSLTPKGEKVCEQAVKRESIHKILSCLSEEERDQLTSYLGRLRTKALQDLGDNSQPPFP